MHCYGEKLPRVVYVILQPFYGAFELVLSIDTEITIPGNLLPVLWKIHGIKWNAHYIDLYLYLLLLWYDMMPIATLTCLYIALTLCTALALSFVWANTSREDFCRATLDNKQASKYKYGLCFILTLRAKRQEFVQKLSTYLLDAVLCCVYNIKRGSR